MVIRSSRMGTGGYALVVILAFLLSAAVTDVLGEASLVILPSQPVLTKPIGRNTLLSCRVEVDNKDLISDLQWRDPQGKVIGVSNESARTGMYTEVMPGGNTLALIIPSLQQTHAGEYTCTANYATTEKLSKSVYIRTIVAITWEDAPEEQYPILNSDYKVKCKVTANPAPLVDWLRDSEALPSGDHYIVDTDGLLIQKATEADDGTYTCRAIVVDTGELQERHIRVEVHTPPTFEDMDTTIKAIETETASVRCKARGKPEPTFAWIKVANKEDLTSAGRFTVDKNTGILTITSVAKEDHGEYKCVATNAAGSVERTVKINVVVKPRIVAYKNVSIATEKEAKLECSASGRPLPDVTFRKLTSPNKYVHGLQASDDRIVVENKHNPEREETVGTLIIRSILRSDDGLYACIANNEGGEAIKNGHLTVEFPPSFANTPMKEVWSWQNNPVNISCLAESIPNATITWKLNNYEVDKDVNIRKVGEGPYSTLQVVPLDQKYYGRYKCRAVNTHGWAEHEIELKEAKPPSEILQAKLEVITATTITFSFMGPANHGGLPTRAYAVQYKEERQDWKDARNKTWPVDSPYILEGLEPQTTYHFRFAAKNDVGFGSWAAAEQHTMPKRSNPEEPLILTTVPEDGVVMSPYPDTFELRWKIPPDNGEPIDMYEVKFCAVRRVEGSWKEMDSQCDTVELQTHERTAYELRLLRPDTHYKIELRAHNAIGYSTPGEVIIKTARGLNNPVAASEDSPLSSGAIVSIVVASLFVILIIVDLSCYVVNRAGILYALCEKTRSSKPNEEDPKLNSLYSWRFPLPYCSNKDSSQLGSGISMEKLSKVQPIDEKEPLKEAGTDPIIQGSIKKETSVDFDIKKSISRTSFVGKDSAV